MVIYLIWFIGLDWGDFLKSLSVRRFGGSEVIWEADNTFAATKARGRERTKALWRRKQQGTAITNKDNPRKLKRVGAVGLWGPVEKTTTQSLDRLKVDCCSKWREAGWRRKQWQYHTCNSFGCKCYFLLSVPLPPDEESRRGDGVTESILDRRNCLSCKVMWEPAAPQHEWGFRTRRLRILVTGSSETQDPGLLEMQILLCSLPPFEVKPRRLVS